MLSQFFSSVGSAKRTLRIVLVNQPEQRVAQVLIVARISMPLPHRLLVFLVVGLVPALAAGRSDDRVELFRERSGKVVPPEQFDHVAPVL